MRIVCQAQCSASNTCGQHPHNNVPDRICQGLHASQFLSRANSAKRLHKRLCAGRSSSLHGVARHSSHLTRSALQSVSFNPKKLTVEYQSGTLVSGSCCSTPRCYTLTHNDVTGQLLLTIGPQYNTRQLSGWYSRLLRDEILAYWQFNGASSTLHIECHVSGRETWLAPPILRDYIFRREMPLVLNIINFAEAKFLGDNPSLASAQVVVHLSSHVEAYHASVPWGNLSDCSSWQPPPRWVWSALQPTAQTQGGACPSATFTHTDDTAGKQGVASINSEAAAHNEPCVIASFGLNSDLEACATSEPAERCSQSPELDKAFDQANIAGLVPAQAPNAEDQHAISNHRAVCHTLQIGRMPSMVHMALPTNLPGPMRTVYAGTLLGCTAAVYILL